MKTYYAKQGIWEVEGGGYPCVIFLDKDILTIYTAANHTYPTIEEVWNEYDHTWGELPEVVNINGEYYYMSDRQLDGRIDACVKVKGMLLNFYNNG